MTLQRGDVLYSIEYGWSARFVSRSKEGLRIIWTSGPLKDKEATVMAEFLSKHRG